MQITTTVIGLGNIGLLYKYNSNEIQTHIKAIAENKNFKILAGIDIDKKKNYF